MRARILTDDVRPRRTAQQNERCERCAGRCYDVRVVGRCALAVMAVVLAGCEVFSTRVPDPPVEDTGTYEQPDTPDLVVVNLQNAIAELNAQNYRRSFADEFVFEPTANAAARFSIWNGWGAQEEESYFRGVAEAARLTEDNSLRLSDVQETFEDTRFVVDASYQLTINHRQANLSSDFQGRLVWVMVQGEDGLWRITEWTDRDIGPEAWSDLKAAFTN